MGAGKLTHIYYLKKVDKHLTAGQLRLALSMMSNIDQIKICETDRMIDAIIVDFQSDVNAIQRVDVHGRFTDLGLELESPWFIKPATEEDRLLAKARLI